MTEPFIIMSAPNGARRQKSDHPALPVSPCEMADCAREIVEAGASMLHLHVRDDQGAHSLDVGRYRASIKAIQDAVGRDIIIQATSEAVGHYNRQQQMAMVRRLKPEAVSLALRELCPADQALGDFSDFIQWMDKEHIFPQYILYDEQDYQRFEAYRKMGVFHNDQPFVLFVLGKYQDSTLETAIMAGKLTERTKKVDFPWAVCGFGPEERDAITHAARHQGHIRVGFENNIWQAENSLLSSHGQMINICGEAARNNNRPVASATQVRHMFDIRE